MGEENHQVSLAGPQTSPPAHRQFATEGFYRRWEGLTIEKGFVLFRERAIILTALGTKVPKRLHQGYPGIQRINSLAGNKITGREQTKNLKKWFLYSALRNSINAASQGNNATRGLHKTNVGANEHKHWSSTTGKAISHHRGRLYKVRGFYFSVQHDIPTDSGITSWTIRPTWSSRDNLSATKWRSLTHTSLWSSVCLTLSVTFCRRAYHPKSNERPESFFDTLKRGLLKLWAEGDVDNILDSFLLA
jgi:hypothetical protein